jgi:hypothetical protein
MVCKISYGEKIINDDYIALNQEERKLLGQLVRDMREGDKLTPETDLLERAYHMVQTRLIDCD